MAELTMNDLREYIKKATITYRKGEEVEQKDGATHIYAMPPVSEAKGETVDVHFIVVGFDEEYYGLYSDEEIRQCILSNPDGDFTTITEVDWKQGPSYITVGAWIGSQDLALRFFALGKRHEIFDVMTPALLGIEGEMANAMAGQGMIFASLKRVEEKKEDDATG